MRNLGELFPSWNSEGLASPPVRCPHTLLGTKSSVPSELCSSAHVVPCLLHGQRTQTRGSRIERLSEANPNQSLLLLFPSVPYVYFLLKSESCSLPQTCYFLYVSQLPVSECLLFLGTARSGSEARGWVVLRGLGSHVPLWFSNGSPLTCRR